MKKIRYLLHKASVIVNRHPVSSSSMNIYQLKNQENKGHLIYRSKENKFRFEEKRDEDGGREISGRGRQGAGFSNLANP